MIIIAEVSELTRKIKLPTDRVISVNGDYQVDGIAFKLPATYEGDFDFSAAAVRVHWTGVDKVEHTNLITEEDGNGYPLWVMPSELTQGGHGVIEFAVSFVATDETAAVTKRWISDPVSFRNRRTVNGSNEDEEAEEEVIYDRLASAIAAVRAAQASVDDVAEVLSSLGTLTFHFVDAKADMTDQTKLYVLTTDGYLYYYSTAASDFVPAFEVGGSQEVIDARTDENGTTYANLKTRINTGFTQLKEDLSGIQAATAEDVGKALKAKTVTDGKVTEWEFGETGDKNAVPLPVEPESKYGASGQVLETLGDGKTRWKSVGAVDPSVIESAVTDWLNEHPEATTTVQDGSITETKLATELTPTLKNNYATPEMFGAKGDATTDDTQAIINMFASDYKVFRFANKSYLVNGAIDITKKCTIYFNNTELVAKASNAVRDFNYIIGFKAYDIATFGKLTVSGNNAVNVCVWLAECGRSSFDVIATNNARIWGVYIDQRTNGNNTLSFNKLSASQCGYKVTAKARRITAKQLSLTNITCSKSRFEDIRRSLFNNEYANSYIVIDDSGYTGDQFLHNRAVFLHTTAGISSSPFTLDEEDPTVGTFTINQTVIPLNYASEEDVNVFIPIGGGISLKSKNSEGVLHIGRLETMSNPMGSSIDLGYGGRIDSYASEYDTLIMHCDSLVLSIGYMYIEATGNGYQYKFNNAYDKIVSLSSNSNGRIYVDNPFTGISNVPFAQGQGIVYDKQFKAEQSRDGSILRCPGQLTAKLIGRNDVRNDTAISTIINEYSPRTMTLDAKGFNGGSFRSIKLNLIDLNAYFTNGFEPFVMYVRKFDTSPNYRDFSITLDTALINAGYSLYGGVDNVIMLNTHDYNDFMKITIILFARNKKFYVTVEPLTFIDQSQT